jgi:diaminohydroxyphosphoribosylaminopyrimidine deaminase/5-amino-6-(5-phosphoribosylamino)uracil reductase
LRHAGVEIARVPGRSRPDLRAVAEELGRRQILSVLLEAGPRLNWAALEAGLVDKMFLFYSPRILGGGHAPMVRGGYSALGAAPALRDLTLHRFGRDFAVQGYLRDVYRNR